jgi:hypothetical protein
VQASSCVPAAPGLEISGADFAAKEIRELLSWPEIAGLAEVMDMRAVLEAHPRMVGILSEALASGKIIEGHARGLTGAALQAYLAAGVSADHEITSGADAPAVTAMVWMFSSHCGWTSVRSSTRYAGTPIFSQTSTRRRELELFCEPTTSNIWHNSMVRSVLQTLTFRRGVKAQASG